MIRFFPPLVQNFLEIVAREKVTILGKIEEFEEFPPFHGHLFNMFLQWWFVKNIIPANDLCFLQGKPRGRLSWTSAHNTVIFKRTQTS